ncbi:leucyl aminopeptidase [Corynebacterium macclintockiae]|uniref:leucyl aminopeptidase n=1 Tax=Corynebacterium macclintockiae TaxID=2913501 RepID=UPI003EB6EC1B
MTANSSTPQFASFGADIAGLPSRGYIPQMSLVHTESALESTSAETPPVIDTLVIPVFEGESGLELTGAPIDALTSEQQLEMWKLLISVGAKGTAGEVTVVPNLPVSSRSDVVSTGNLSAKVQESTQDPETADGVVDAGAGSRGPEKILAIGMGPADEVSAEDVRVAAGVASRNIKKPIRDNSDDKGENTGRGARVVSALGLLGAEAALVGHALGAYEYRGLKTSEAAPAIESIEVLTGEDPADTLEHSLATVRAVALARDLVNTPSNVLYPESYAAIIAEAAKHTDIEVEVLDEAALEEQGFGGILGVGQGSARGPRLVRLDYNPDKTANDSPRVALVGKGITFDTGGISLKPPAKMWNMISDMGGSAAVVAAVIAAAELNIPVHVTATVPLAENMPGGEATRPGDVLRHYGGTTTEVWNTDAEGRLVLADAIVRACEDKPDYLIETATLTGAQLVALGDRTPGIMGSMDFRDRVAMISQRVGDAGWPMPLPAELGEALQSDVADIKNISASRWGGMSVAGHYLKKFVAEGVQWVHIDVAGPAYNEGAPHGYTPKRATGSPVRTIIAALEDIALKG